MAPLDTRDRATVLAFLKARLPTANVDELEALLDASAGETCDEPAVTVYRPWWIIASVMQSNPEIAKSFRSAAGDAVEYRDPKLAMNQILNTQRAMDNQLCSVPEGFEATPLGMAGGRTLVRAYA